MPVTMCELERGLVIAGNGTSTFVAIFTMTASTVGVLLSSLAVLLLLATAFLFAEWRRVYKNQLLIQFMIARFIYTIVRYSMDIFDALKIVDPNFMEYFGSVFPLVYSEMVLVVWMFVFTKQMYVSFTKVFDTEEHTIWRLSAMCWTIPCFFTLSVYMAFLYCNEFMSIYVIISCLIKWPTFIANGVLLILITKSIVAINMSRKSSNFRIIGIMIILIINLCIQQLFIDICKILIYRYFNRSDNDSLPIEVYYALVAFNIYSLYVCAFVIFFWLFGNANTRKLWSARIRRKRNIEHVVVINVLAKSESNLDKLCSPMSEPARIPRKDYSYINYETY